MQKLVIGIGGASGAVYAKRLLDRVNLLKHQIAEVAVVMTENGKINWNLEIGHFDTKEYPRPNLRVVYFSEIRQFFPVKV